MGVTPFEVELLIVAIRPAKLAIIPPAPAPTRQVWTFGRGSPDHIRSRDRISLTGCDLNCVVTSTGHGSHCRYRHIGRWLDSCTRDDVARISPTRKGEEMKFIIVTALAIAPLLAMDKDSVKRLDEATAVFSEIMATPDKGIPQEMLENAHCIVIVPSMKTAAFVFGAKYGKGYLSCRNKNKAGWSAPGTVRIEGGSFGFQIGGSETDLIMLVMNERGADRLLSSKFTLGAEGSVAAGPVGRTATAQTDAQMHAEILSWSRTQGLFAGIALSGATLRPDLDDNQALYGKRIGNREIVTSGMHTPEEAGKLIGMLNRYSRREHKDVSENGR
jgi:SH3 domain-containing YSC84-like protein 1